MSAREVQGPCVAPMMLHLVCTDAEAPCCSRVFPNEEMDLFATAVRQVARTLLAVHVTLQMGFEEEV